MKANTEIGKKKYSIYNFCKNHTRIKLTMKNNNKEMGK